jgi:hypothetical protein
MAKVQLGEASLGYTFLLRGSSLMELLLLGLTALFCAPLLEKKDKPAPPKPKPEVTVIIIEKK